MDEYITIALPKGKLFDKSVRLLAKVGYSAENVTEDSRKLVISNEETKVRFIIAKTVDVPTYVEYGAADIGIIGKDGLLEQDKDVVELLWPLPPDDGGAGGQATRQADGLCSPEGSNEVSELRQGLFQ